MHTALYSTPLSSLKVWYGERMYICFQLPTYPPTHGFSYREPGFILLCVAWPVFCLQMYVAYTPFDITSVCPALVTYIAHAIARGGEGEGDDDDDGDGEDETS